MTDLYREAMLDDKRYRMLRVVPDTRIADAPSVEFDDYDHRSDGTVESLLPILIVGEPGRYALVRLDALTEDNND